MPAPQRVLLEVVADVARAAGDVATRHFRRSPAVELKSDGSEVTAADREAETRAREMILQLFPGDAVLGEEYGASGRPGVRRWLIDPIDGTRSFIRGVPLWGTLVAVEESGTVLAGAICCPATGDLVVAARGEGCWHNDSRARVSAVADLASATILATDSRFPTNPARAHRWSALAASVGIARTWGDCYGYVLVATGRAELMADDRLNPWDAAALVPVIEEAGGVYTDWRGQPGIGADGVATNAALANALRQRLGIPESPAS